jgi:uncharacterized membrane protein
VKEVWYRRWYDQITYAIIAAMLVFTVVNLYEREWAAAAVDLGLGVLNLVLFLRNRRML